MTFDLNELKRKSDVELHAWMLTQEHGTEEYNAGIRETMRRIALAEDLAEKKDPATRRELIAIGIAAICLLITIMVIVVKFQG